MKNEIKTIGYIPKFKNCPYLSGSNKCSRVRSKSVCIYSKNVKKCPYYNQWLKQRKVYQKGSNDPQDIKEMLQDGV